MNSKNKMLCAFAVLLFIGSLAIGSVSASYSLAGTANNEQLIPAETYGDDRRNEAVNILMYTELADLTVGGEYDNVIASMIGSLEGKFTYDNLTDYTQLGGMIGEFDVLLILESENGNYTFSDTVNAAWADILPSFVTDGGIVICMTYAHGPGQYGASLGIINGTIIDVYDPETANTHQIDLFDSSDALARNVPASYTGASGSISFDAPGATKVMEDNTNSKPVVVHKTMGKGHIVLLGFDMFTDGVAEQDTLLQNAILLHRHVVFDNSHAQYFDFTTGFNTISDDLPYYGFAVSSMDTFDSTMLEACEILVISFCNTNYSASEIDMIEDFVIAGGGLFIITEWGSFGDHTDSLMDNFGFARNKTHTLEDSDDYVTNTWWPVFYPENLNMHSTKVGVDILEVYGAPCLTEIPESAVPLITTDTDGTATMGGVDEANGVPMAASDLVGAGRIVVVTDCGLLGDYDTDSDGTEDYFDSDNELFTRNIFRWLSGAGIPEQTVVFDQSNNPYAYLHGYWNPLANFLMFNGYNVEWMNTFTPTDFEEADVLVICDGSLDYNTTEITYITDFVSEGGALLLWGDNTVLCEQIDPIGQEFGLQINTTGYLIDSDDSISAPQFIAYDGDNIGNHSIMDGVERLEVYCSNAFISIGTGTALISTDSDGTSTWFGGGPAINLPVYAATTFNMGRVVFLTDVDTASSVDPDSDGFSALYDSDNPIFLANVFTWLAENRAPTVDVISPNGGEVLNGTITISWDAVDFDSDPLTFDVFYSDNNGSDWTVLANDLAVLEFAWNTTLHDDGISYMIRVEVSDGVLAGQDESDNPFELDNIVGGGGLVIDPNLLLIIGAAALVVIVIVIIMKKKK